jgi:hypothetical protein
MKDDLGAFKYFVGDHARLDNRLSSSSPTYRPRSNGEYFRQSFTGVTQSNADWAVITSFNEWVEGSQIEPSVTYGDQYLKLSADLANTYRATAGNYVTAPTETPVPTDTPTPTNTPTHKLTRRRIHRHLRPPTERCAPGASSAGAFAPAPTDTVPADTPTVTLLPRAAVVMPGRYQQRRKSPERDQADAAG